MAAVSSGERGVRAGVRIPRFGFLTNHGKTLLLLAENPRIRMRDIAARLNITERATQQVIADLDRADYIDRRREGRRNVYTLRTHLPLGLPTQRDVDIHALLRILDEDGVSN